MRKDITRTILFSLGSPLVIVVLKLSLSVLKEKIPIDQKGLEGGIYQIKN